MTYTKMAKAVNDEALYSVTGGNYGDKKTELDNDIALYNVGDTVEVFTTSWHIWTKRGVIIFAERRRIDTTFVHGSFTLYTVKYEDGSTEQVSANDIERK